MDDASGSFESYVRARIAALSWIAYLLTGDHHAAEDLVQQSLLRVAGRWRQIVASGDPDAYVRRVLYTQHVSRWRRNRPAVLIGGHADRAAVVPDPSGDIALAVTVQRALARLAPKQRAVLVLRYFEDMSEAQTAEVLGCRVGTVKSQVRDALARLRRIAPELLDDVTTEVGA